MNKRTIATAIVAMCVSSAGYAADKVKIGFIGALSGPVSVLGEDQKRGLEIALQHLNNKIGGLPVELITADSKGNPNIAVQEASKLMDRDKVDFLTGVTLTNEVLALSKPIRESETFLIGTGGGAAPLAGKECNPYFFNLTTQGEQFSEALGIYMTQKGIKSVYLIAMDYQWGWDQVSGFKKNFKGNIVGESLTPAAQMDFSAEFAQVRVAKPEAVVAFYVGAGGIAFSKQFAQGGLKATTPLYSHPGTFDSFTFGALGDSGLGVILTNMVSTERDAANNKKFVESYREKYKRNPSTLAFVGYDAAMLMDSAVKAVKGDLKNKDAVRAALRKADFDSVRGPFKFNTNHMPVQQFHAFKVDKKADGEMYLAPQGLVVESLKDELAAECPMK